MADDVVIYSPIVPEPFKGKQQVQEILKQLLLTVDAFTPKLVLQDGADFTAIFTIELGPNKLDGMDHMHVNEAGFIDSMTVAWRPLPAVVEVQKFLAPQIRNDASHIGSDGPSCNGVIAYTARLRLSDENLKLLENQTAPCQPRLSRHLELRIVAAPRSAGADRYR